jgi:YHYH protein
MTQRACSLLRSLVDALVLLTVTACSESVSKSSSEPTPKSVPRIDLTSIPVGDGRLSTTTPQIGYVYACSVPTSPNPPGRAPWISADGKTWNKTTKTAVQGAVQWVSELAFQIVGGRRTVTGNGLPNHVTGTFPIAANDPARAYDGNPNSIRAVAIAWGLPLDPVVAAQPTCTALGAIGVLLTGARVFNALDADGRDAVAHETQDNCDGHPQGTSVYHYHNLSRCAQVTDDSTRHSPLVGFIADGFGLYGNRGEGGAPLTNAELDVCHGHSHAIDLDGRSVVQYHYHATVEYPFTVGCYRGTPVAIR